ncbi:MAG: OmpA family protein [Ignavibacteriales bacterium]|nr:OmpA family protein [Ignavibacteriales bacterium]MCF8368947.1 OmpA family protein [Bacteroidales bacterium]MCF8404769.1 OmpA family protein [Bacteroidales bacterium]
MKTFTKNNLLLVTILISMFCTSNLFSQDAKLIIFNDARTAYLLAIEKRAEILSPSNFEEGLKYYEKANSAYEKEDNLADIKEYLKEAVKYFQKSTSEINVMEVLFAETLNSRDDALDAEADLYQKELWEDAQSEFRNATHEYEKGNSDRAKKKGKEAYDLYRQAELAAIKSNLFNNARELIAKADDMKADKYAPKTMAKAKKSFEDGQAALETERYDTDKPRMLAKNAEYEASHAIYLVNYIMKIEDQDKEIEDLILKGESYLTQIGDATGISVRFDEGSSVAAQNISTNVILLKDSIFRLSHNLNICERTKANQVKQIAANAKQIEAMGSMQQDQITDASLKQKLLEDQIAYEQKVVKKFDEVFNTFDINEANVFRQGNDIILRMTGFNFDIGSAEVKPENYPLLAKVQKAINIFSASQIVIQGHTDSQGGDNLNLTLSQKRADAVKAYLMANMPDYDQANIESIGYGESKPIENNETKYGRSLNRRIDVVIKVKRVLDTASTNTSSPEKAGR